MTHFMRQMIHTFDQFKPYAFRRIGISVCLALALSACAGLSDDPEEVGSPPTAEIPAQETLPKFSEQQAKSALPSGWSFYRSVRHKISDARIDLVTNASEHRMLAP